MQGIINSKTSVINVILHLYFFKCCAQVYKFLVPLSCRADIPEEWKPGPRMSTGGTPRPGTPKLGRTRAPGTPKWDPGPGTTKYLSRTQDSGHLKWDSRTRNPKYLSGIQDFQFSTFLVVIFYTKYFKLYL